MSNTPEGVVKVSHVVVSYYDAKEKEWKNLHVRGKGSLLLKSSSIKSDNGEPAIPTRALSITMSVESESVDE